MDDVGLDDLLALVNDLRNEVQRLTLEAKLKRINDFNDGYYRGWKDCIRAFGISADSWRSMDI